MRVSLELEKILNLLWHIFYVFGQLYSAVNGPILKIILPSGHTGAIAYVN